MDTDPVISIRKALSMFEEAMKKERVGEQQILRVINRLLYDNPHGPGQPIDPQAELFRGQG